MGKPPRVQGWLSPAKGPGRGGPRDSVPWRMHYMAWLWFDLVPWRVHYMAWLWFEELEELEASGHSFSSVLPDWGRIYPQLPSSQLMRKNFVLKIQSCWLLFFGQMGHLRNFTILFCSQVPSDPRPISLHSPVSTKSLLKVESPCRESGGRGIMTVSSATQKAVLGRGAVTAE